MTAISPTMLLRDGIERMTVHWLAGLSGKRVNDVLFVLDCERIAVDPRDMTVAVADLVARWPDSFEGTS